MPPARSLIDGSRLPTESTQVSKPATNPCYTLKLRLMSEPILALSSDRGTFILDCDASNYGLGAVLSQEQSGIEEVIA